MPRKKKKVDEKEKPKISDKEISILQNDYANELMTNPEFSLSVDPEKKYNFSDEQKKFIENYVQFKSIKTAAEVSNLPLEQAMEFFVSFNSQNEIRRINRALYHRQFQSKLLSLDDIGGYLSSLLTDENVPLADQLRTVDKLKVVSLLLDLNELKKDTFIDPQKIMSINIENQLKDLSVSAISRLLSESKNPNKEKEKIINADNLTVEEKEYLKTLSSDELLNIINKKEK